MTPSRCIPVLLLLHLLIPLASAGGTLATPVLEAHVRDRFGDACSPRVAGFCLADVNAEGDPGSWTVDAYASFEYVGVATNFSRLRDPAGSIVLLPDASVGLRFADLTVRHPILRTVHEHQDNVPATPVQELYGARVEPDALVHWYYGPSVYNPLSPPRTHRVEGHWATEDGLQYDRFTVPHQLRFTTTDAFIEVLPGVGCRIQRGTVCAILPANHVADQAKAKTPNLLLGLDYHAAQIATDPHALTPPSRQTQTNRESLPGTPASAPPLPNAPLTRSLPAEPPSTLATTLGTRSTDLPQVPSTPESAPSTSLRSIPPPTAPRTPAPLLVAGTVGTALLALALLFYHRLTRREVLEQPTRQALLDLVARAPGVSPSAAARLLAIDFRAVMYHARLLQKAGQLSIVQAPARRVRLYRAGARPPTDPHDPLTRATDHPVSRATLLEIARAGATTRDHLLEAVDAPRATLHWHLRRLIDSGLVHENATEHRPARLTIPSGQRERVVDRLLGFAAAGRGGEARAAPSAPIPPAGARK